MSNKRPRGLWKSRQDEAPLPGVSLDVIESSGESSSLPRKRPRFMKLEEDEHVGELQLDPPEKETADWEDWEDLKELYDKAVQQYQGDRPQEALPVLRGVLHECDRILRILPDPSVLFVPRTHRSSSFSPPPRASTSRDRSPLNSPPVMRELPTAFHAIYGSTLFLFGNLIAKDPSLAKSGEPNSGTPYYLAALDVFETGENLPSKIARDPGGEDWRMAIAWGRTLVCLADEYITRAESGEAELSPGYSTFSTGPVWHRESPFSTQAARRPPVARRMTLIGSSPHDILVMAADQISRGILYMPHPRSHRFPGMLGRSTPASPVSSTSSIPASPNERSRETDVPRSKILYTLATEVLAVTERLSDSSQREYWSQWADNVLSQMEMEAETNVHDEEEASREAWVPFSTAYCRGRCWLIVGSARAEPLEKRLEKGDSTVLTREEAEDARIALSNAVSHFYRARSFLSTQRNLHEPADLQLLIAETLVTLGNLTVDQFEQEELFRRAKREGGEDVDLDFDGDTTMVSGTNESGT